MTWLIVGMIIFYAIHFVPMIGLKPALVSKIGAGGYKGVFYVLSFIGLGLMVWGFAQARIDPNSDAFVYEPKSWGRHVTMALVALAFMSLMASAHKGRLTKFLRNPMSIGFALWATGHLFANGHQYDVLLFGSILLYSLIDIIYSTLRKPVPEFVVKPKHDFIIVGAGLLVYVAVMFAHPYFTGVAVM